MQKVSHLTMVLLLLVISSIKVMALEITLKGPNGQPVKDVVFYVSGSMVDKYPDITNEKLVIHQKSKKFAPYITVTKKGAAVAFVNQDDITHHIYSSVGENRFAIKLKAGSDTLEKTFDHEGAVPMGCNIHDWMSGHVLVVDTPFFAKTDSNGIVSFPLSKVGDYTIHIWHPQLSELDNKKTKLVTISTDQPQSIAWQLSNKMGEIPQQQSLDDFDFLDDY